VVNEQRQQMAVLYVRIKPGIKAMLAAQADTGAQSGELSGMAGKATRAAAPTGWFTLSTSL
jgi:hypothetical protein